MSRTRVTTGSRLHFGLMRLPPTPDWTDDGRRYYGGAGLMIDAPGMAVEVAPAAEWTATGPLAQRALRAAQRVTQSMASDARFSILVERSAPEHVGLGTGTQLELAVATAVSRTLGRSDNAVAVARILGRGRRSAIGVHGFEHGGFILDGGKRRPDELGALVHRLDFPPEWRIVLLFPNTLKRWHGQNEHWALAAAGGREDDRLPVLLESLARSLTQRDFSQFSEQLFEYNALAGELFRPVQAGRYADPAIEQVIDWIRRQAISGCGQSSWGPTVFALVEDEKRARQLLDAAPVPRQIAAGTMTPGWK